MVSQILVLSSQQEYAQAMRQCLLSLGKRVDVELDGLRAMQLMPQAYDLIVLDRILHAMDGLQLLLLWRQQAPASIFVIVSDSAAEESRTEALRQGANLFLTRPVGEEDWAGAHQAMASELHRERTNNVSNEPEPELLLADVVQMNCLSGNSVVLEITAKEQHGDIFIHEGSVFHAQFPGRSGPDAFQEMLRWNGGMAQIKTQALQHLPPRTIEGSCHDLLRGFIPVEPLPGGDRIPVSDHLARWAGETTAAADISEEAPPRVEAAVPAPADAPESRASSAETPDVEAHWKVDMMGLLVEGSGVRDPDHCALVTNFIFRKMADIAVALEVDYFDFVTLRGDSMQQVLVADNWGVRHAILEAKADEGSRDRYRDWAREQSF